MRRRGIQLLIWSVVAVVGLGFLGVSGVGLWMYMNHDRPELIDDPVVESAIAAACTKLTADVQAAAVPHGAPLAERVAAIRRQNQAMWDLINEVHQVGDARLDGDLPSRRWLDDWKAITGLRERAVVELAAGTEPTFAIPTVGGRPITDRMKNASGCTVPTELTTLP